MNSNLVIAAQQRAESASRSVGSGILFAFKTFKLTVAGPSRWHLDQVNKQARALIVESMPVVLTMVFVLGLVAGIQGVYTARTFGAPSVAGAFTAVADLRELAPYAFAYMMSAKVSAGYVAELGTMRISDEIDALEVVGIDSLLFLGVSRFVAVLIVLPAAFALAIFTSFFASYLAVVVQVGDVSPGGYWSMFWSFQSPIEYFFSLIKVMSMSIFVVIVGIYYGFSASGGPVGVGEATARAMKVNLVGVHVIGLLASQIFWAGNARLPFGG